MKLKNLALGIVAVLSIAACKKEQAVRPDSTAELALTKQTNACQGLQSAWTYTAPLNFFGDYINVSSITTDVFDDVLLAGIYSGVTDLNPGPGVFNATGRGVFVSKLSAGGKFKGAWTIPIHNLTNNVSPWFDYTTLNTDKQGNIYLTITTGLTGAEQNQVVKADKNGKIIYNVKFGYRGASSLKSVIDSKGCVISLGSNGTGIYLHKIDQNGKILGKIEYSEIEAFNPLKLAIDNDDNLYAMAEFYSEGPLLYNIYFQVDKTGKLTHQDRTTSGFAVDRAGFVYKIGAGFAKYTRNGVKLADYPTKGLVDFKCDMQGNLYTLYEGDSQFNKKLTGPKGTAILPIPTTSNVKLVPDNKGGVITQHITMIVTGDDRKFKFHIRKYDPCN